MNSNVLSCGTTYKSNASCWSLRVGVVTYLIAKRTRRQWISFHAFLRVIDALVRGSVSGDRTRCRLTRATCSDMCPALRVRCIRVTLRSSGRNEFPTPLAIGVGWDNALRPHPQCDCSVMSHGGRRRMDVQIGVNTSTTLVVGQEVHSDVAKLSSMPDGPKPTRVHVDVADPRCDGAPRAHPNPRIVHRSAVP